MCGQTSENGMAECNFGAGREGQVGRSEWVRIWMLGGQGLELRREHGQVFRALLKVLIKLECLRLGCCSGR